MAENKQEQRGGIGDSSRAVNSVAGELFHLRYRRGSAGVQTGMLRARDLPTAIEVGRAYCNSIAGAAFISVVKALLADESILDPVAGNDIRERLAG